MIYWGMGGRKKLYSTTEAGTGDDEAWGVATKCSLGIWRVWKLRTFKDTIKVYPQLSIFFSKIISTYTKLLMDKR